VSITGIDRAIVSIVVPCLDEEKVLPETLRQLAALGAARPDCEFEFLFVDDGSTDASRDILRSAAQSDPRIRVIGLSRNFGQQVAVTAGLDVARGDAVVLMDCDLQDPPEVVHRMIDRWREGYDVVYGARASRPGDGLFKRMTAQGFSVVMNHLSEVPIPTDAGDFRLMSRRIVEVLKTMPERHRFLRGMVAWTGFRQTALLYDRPPRFAGHTKYPFRKMMRYAADGILSFSIRPLRMAIGLGLTAAGLAIAGIVYALIMRLFTSVWVEGWTAMMIAILFLGGVQLVSLGIIGEYVGRIYGEVQRRPLYVVREMIGFDALSGKEPDDRATGSAIGPR
jgi:glycosyltransferase involved in cell wall biosynthesis